MIDTHGLKVQLRDYFRERLGKTASFHERLVRVINSFHQASANHQGWKEVLERVARAWENRKPSLLVAQLRQAPGEVYTAGEPPASYFCFASDGSQVLPSRHELPELALLQLGRIALGYRTETPPLVTAKTRLLTPETLETTVAGPLDRPPFDQYVTDERDASELEELAALSEQYPGDAPAVALLDGSLIRWNLEDRSASWRALQLKRLREAFHRLKESGRPVVGYISRPGSREVVHALGVYDYHEKRGQLPRKPVEIMIHSDTGHVSDFGPGITDRLIFERLLQPGQRSGWFASGSYVLQEYGPENRVLFSYLRTEVEVVRLEIPAWAEQYSESIHVLVLDQCRKGRGYPISLAEAHEQAVIRASDRELFYRMASEEWARLRQKTSAKAPLPRPSPKQQRKRRPVF